MNIRECALSAAFFVNLSDEYELLASGAKTFGDYQKSVDFLVRCANRVISEIADAYLQLRHKESILADNKGIVSLSKFSKPPKHIISAKKDGARVSFKEFPDRIETNQTGEITFEYAYSPSEMSLDETLPFMEGRPDSRIIAYGIAAEYFLINGQSDEAIVWDKRFRDGLHNAQMSRRELRVRKRLWA